MRRSSFSNAMKAAAAVRRNRQTQWCARRRRQRVSAETDAVMKIMSSAKPAQSNRPTCRADATLALPQTRKPAAATSIVAPLAQKITRQSR